MIEELLNSKFESSDRRITVLIKPTNDFRENNKGAETNVPGINL